MNFKPKT